MKKTLIAVIIGAALCLGMSTTALAHGHGGGHHGGYYSGGGNYTSSSSSSSSSYSAPSRYYCNVSGCRRTYNHTHNGTSYYGHHAGDGHNHAYGRGHH